MTQLSPTKGASIQRAGGAAGVPDAPTSILGGLSRHVWFCSRPQTRQRRTKTSEPEGCGQGARTDSQNEQLSCSAEYPSWPVLHAVLDSDHKAWLKS